MSSSLPQVSDATAAQLAGVDPLRAFMTLIEQAHSTAPADVVLAVRAGAAHLGAREVRLLLVVFGQELLRPMTARGATGGPEVRVDEFTAAGQAYMLSVPVEVPAPGGGVVIACPLLDGIERLGVLELTVAAGGEPMQSWCRRFTEMVTQYIATKGRYTDVLHLLRENQPMSLAAQLQWQMLPPITAHVPAVTVAAQLEPAYDVGGDAFDYAFSADVLHLAMFDAMGHGVPAGVTTSLALGAYRNSRRRDIDLPGLLNRIDEETARQFPDERFLTALLGTLDYATGQVTMVTAGAPQPLLLRDHRTVAIPAIDPVPPLGLGLGALLPRPVTFVMQPGDQLLLVTDGILDAQNDQGDRFGEEQLVALAEQATRQGLPLAEIARAITRGVSEYQDGGSRDDASLLIVQYHGLPRIQSAGRDGLRGMTAVLAEPEWSACIALPPSRTSPRSARRLLEVAAAEWDLPDLDSAELLLTELVTNAAVHARTDMVVHFSVTSSRLRIAVSDCSGEPPHRRHPTLRSEHGRGLVLLQQLSQDWGWQQDSDSSTCKTVWFEVARGVEAPIGDFDVDSVEPI